MRKRFYVALEIKLYINIEKDVLLSYEKTYVDTLNDIIVAWEMI
ncbi:hypothetical protein [uncultured Clostridium sp.]|nr:hypothetical protein [uncultured Clostridium sp.]